MKSLKPLYPNPKSRAVSTSIAVGLAVLLTVSLLEGLRKVAVVRAAPFNSSPSAEMPLVSTTPISPTLEVGVNAEFWPMEYISDDQIVGHDIDLMNAIAAETGVTVDYINTPWADLLTALEDGEFDAVISAVDVTPEREEIVDFTLPYVTVTFGDSDCNWAVAIREQDDVLRIQMNEALRELRADGTLETIIAAIAADMPEWQPRLPAWPFIYLPVILKNYGSCKAEPKMKATGFGSAGD